MKRHLVLKRETLVELSATELVNVAGGALPSGATCPLQSCLCISERIGECVTWSCDVR